jgi:hypothetical protein
MSRKQQTVKEATISELKKIGAGIVAVIIFLVLFKVVIYPMLKKSFMAPVERAQARQAPAKTAK